MKTFKNAAKIKDIDREHRIPNSRLKANGSAKKDSLRASKAKGAAVLLC
jgi:hypothetical protein